MMFFENDSAIVQMIVVLWKMFWWSSPVLLAVGLRSTFQ